MPAIDFNDLFQQADRMRNNGKVGEAIEAYKDIARLSKEDNELDLLGRALHMAGVSAKENVEPGKGEYYNLALQFLNAAIAIFQQTGNQLELGAVYRDMAIVNDYANHPNNAVTYFQKSISILEPIGNYQHLAITYDKFGLHFYKLSQFKQAQDYINKALELFRQTTPGFFHATTLFDLSRVKFKLSDYDQAYELAKESLSYFEADHGAISHIRRQAQINGALAVITAKLGQNDQAKSYFQKYQKLLTQLDPLTGKVVSSDIEELAK